MEVEIKITILRTPHALKDINSWVSLSLAPFSFNADRVSVASQHSQLPNFVYSTRQENRFCHAPCTPSVLIENDIGVDQLSSFFADCQHRLQINWLRWEYSFLRNRSGRSHVTLPLPTRLLQTDIHSFLGVLRFCLLGPMSLSFSCHCIRCTNHRREHSQENESHTLIGLFPRKECMSVGSSRVGTGSVTWLRPERLRRRVVRVGQLSLQAASIIHAKTMNIERCTKPYLAPEILFQECKLLKSVAKYILM